ncbi:MAG: ABC transporter substrate-binding protein [Bacteroidetes bacterium CG2_30_33_31]|nr:MAG: ABC transporter substrate-binding protein [Bacteroidetes bacterium CG2_30_33_31]
MIKIFIPIVIISLLAIYSCGNRFEPMKGKSVFRYNESSGITSLDPAFARDQANIWACNQLFNGLIQLDENLHVIPSIAKSWEILDDGTTYNFHLRQDIFFHNWSHFKNGKGRKVIASDFEYSIKRILNPKTLSPGAVWLNNIVKNDKGIYEVKALNDSTLTIKLESPFSPFLGRLSMPYFSAVPKEAVDFYGEDFGRNPVGTGPFYFKMMEDGVKLVMLKNKHYFEFDGRNRLPYLDAVAVSFIIDKQSVFLEFIKGNLDFMSGIDPSYKDELLQADGSLNPKYAKDLNMQSKPYLNTEYLGFQMDKAFISKTSPLQIKAIRQAINYGFDRKKMIRYLRNNIGIAGENGFVPLGMPGFENKKTKGYDFNPELAKELLAKAGFPYGKNLPSITLSTTSAYVDIAKFMQQQLGEIGMNIEIDVHQPAALRQMIANCKIPLFRGSWIGDYADAENYLSLFYSKNFCPNGANYTHYFNQVFDKLFEQARNSKGESQRLDLYRQMDQLVTDEAPFVILYYDEVLRFSHKKVKNLGINSMNILNLKKVNIEEKRLVGD